MKYSFLILAFLFQTQSAHAFLGGGGGGGNEPGSCQSDEISCPGAYGGDFITRGCCAKADGVYCDDSRNPGYCRCTGGRRIHSQYGNPTLSVEPCVCPDGKVWNEDEGKCESCPPPMSKVDYRCGCAVGTIPVGDPKNPTTCECPNGGKFFWNSKDNAWYCTNRCTNLNNHIDDPNKPGYCKKCARDEIVVKNACVSKKSHCLRNPGSVQCATRK